MASAEDLASVRDQLFGLISEERIAAVSFDRPDPQIVASLQAVPDVSSIVSDAMDRLGIGARIPASTMRPLGRRQRVCGPAITIRYTQHGGDVNGIRRRGEASGLAEREMYAVGRAGDVAVFDCGGCQTGSVMGSISARWARRFGIAGCVIDGAVRDVEGIEDEGVPVWSRGVTPASGNYRMRAVEVNGTVAVVGAPVRPGDLIVADSTGICVVPLADVARVAAEVGQIQDGEQAVIEAIDAGVAPRDMPRHTI